MTAPVVEPKPEYTEYAWLSLLALCGSIARAGKWTDDGGKFMPSKLITELASAVVLGSLAVGAGAYFSLKPAIMGGLAGGLGLLGAAGVTGIIQSVISTKFGGTKNASDTKPS
jgi:hypothetical protein